MTDWPTEKAQMLADLNEARAALILTLRSQTIWYRVRQSTVRALEQVEVAIQQLSEQDHPL